MTGSRKLRGLLTYWTIGGRANSRSTTCWVGFWANPRNKISRVLSTYTQNSKALTMESSPKMISSIALASSPSTLTPTKPSRDMWFGPSTNRIGNRSAPNVPTAPEISKINHKLGNNLLSNLQLISGRTKMAVQSSQRIRRVPMINLRIFLSRKMRKSQFLGTLTWKTSKSVQVNSEISSQ